MATAIRPNVLPGMSHRPDETPTSVVGAMAFLTVLIAMVSAAIVATGGSAGAIAASMLTTIAFALMTAKLHRDMRRRTRGGVP